MEVTPYLNVYSTMLGYSQIVVDDGAQICIQENATYNKKQELQHTMTCQKIIQ